MTMLTKNSFAATVVAAALVVPGIAQAKGWELDDPNERLAEIMYGLEQVCIPAQQQGMLASDYEKANRNGLTLSRRQNPVNRSIPMWGVDVRSDVVVQESDGGCTVSTSFREVHADRLIPQLRANLENKAAASEVISGSADNYDERFGKAYCTTQETGLGVDSVLLYEWTQPELLSGQRRPEEILYLTLVVPTTGFCPAS